MHYIEIRPTLKRGGAPKLVPMEDQAKYTGFRSVYAFPLEVAEYIKDANSTRFMQGIDVYSDTLFMDFDDCDPIEFRQWLKDSNIAYEEWDSGNRSVHFHIQIEPMEGPDVPSSQRAWVKKHAPQADVSFYHPTGIYRLPRTYHSKNPGHCKTLVELNSGIPLKIPVTTRTIAPVPTAQDTGNQEEFFTALLQKQTSGHRRPHLWLLATLAAESGITYERAVEYLQWHNSNFAAPPHDEAVISQQAESAYRRIELKYGMG